MQAVNRKNSIFCCFNVAFPDLGGEDRVLFFRKKAIQRQKAPKVKSSLVLALLQKLIIYGLNCSFKNKIVFKA